MLFQVLQSQIETLQIALHGPCQVPRPFHLARLKMRQFRGHSTKMLQQSLSAPLSLQHCMSHGILHALLQVAQLPDLLLRSLSRMHQTPL